MEILDDKIFDKAFILEEFGYCFEKSGENIMLVFKGDENNDESAAVVLDAEDLLNLVMELFKVGIAFEKDFNKSIGFSKSMEMEEDIHA